MNVFRGKLRDSVFEEGFSDGLGKQPSLNQLTQPGVVAIAW